MTTKQPTLTYWQQVWKGFYASKLAVLSLIVILFIIVVAIFCPLLANNKPLVVKAVMQGEYDNHLAVAMELVAQSRDGLDAEKSKLLSSSLNAASAHVAESQRDDFRIDSDLSIDQALAQLDGLFEAELVPVIRYPAFVGLSVLEIYAIFVLLLVPVCCLINKGPLSLRLGIMLLLGILVSYGIRSFIPQVDDKQNYRTFLSSDQFAESGWAVRPLIPYGENENIISDTRQAPTWLLPVEDRRPLRDWHWLGTDTNGRDVLARMVYGARVSMIVGIVAVSIYTIIGILLGAVAGYYKGWTDIVLSRLIEIVICFPPLMVILAVQAYLRPSLVNLILALALLWWTGVARLQRAEFLKLGEMDFVQSIRAIGGSTARIIFLHILPNGLGPVLVLVSFGIAGSILVESALSFLGFGVPQPMASWGDLLNNGRNDIRGTWWLTVFPGLTIFITVTCFNLMGEAIRDALDPRKD